jgi:hypothetical protein
MKISVLASIVISAIVLSASLIFSHALPVQATNTLPPGCSVGSNVVGVLSNGGYFLDGARIRHVGSQWMSVAGPNSGADWFNYDNIVWIRCE